MSQLTISLFGKSSFLILWKFLPNCRIPFAKSTCVCTWYACVVCVCEREREREKEGQGECEWWASFGQSGYCKFSLVFTHNKNACLHKTFPAMGPTFPVVQTLKALFALSTVHNGCYCISWSTTSPHPPLKCPSVTHYPSMVWVGVKVQCIMLM